VFVILDRMEKEAAGRGGGAGGGAGACGQDGWDYFRLDPAAADVEHGSYQVADHVVKKAAASDAVDKEIGRLGLASLPG